MNQPSEIVIDETSVREIISTLWKGKLVIAIITACAIFASSIISFFILPEKYEAFTSLTVSPITLSISDLGNSVSIIDYLATLPMNTKADCVLQVKSTQVLEKTIKELELKDNSGNLIGIDVLSNSITVLDIVGTNRIEIRVSYSDPIVAAQIANTLSLKFAEFVADDCKSQFQEVAALIANQLLIEEDVLLDKKQVLNDYRTKNQDITVLKGEEDNMKKLILANKNTLHEKETQIKSDTTTLKALNASSAFEDIIGTGEFDLSIDINIDPDTSGQNEVNIAPENLEDTLNSIYINKLQNRLITDQAIAQVLEQRVPELEAELVEVQIFLTNEGYNYNKIYDDWEFSQSIYNLLEQRNREVNVYASSSIGDTVIYVSSEAAPGIKISPNRKKNVAVAGMVGLCLGVFFVMSRNYLKKMKVSSPK